MAATDTTIEAGTEAEADLGAQYRIVEAVVTRAVRISPSLMRITFGGEQLREGLRSGGRDQSLTIFFPRPGEDIPLVPLEFDEGWYGRWRALPLGRRAIMRSYTVRSQDPVSRELDVDFVLHGEHGSAPSGPAAAWAADAAPGDRVMLLGPALAANRSIAFLPPPDATRIILAADETALPAVGGILEALPAGTPVQAWVEVPDVGDLQQIATAADAEVAWLVRQPGGRPGTAVAEAVRAAMPDVDDLAYVWIAGEAGLVRTLRRHFVRDLGLDRSRVAFTGYWRLGATEEQLRTEREAGAGR
ncbi:MAG: siderophore-interacting protein [Catenulispora sp.]|nr:siderophore-interacting protein [Catenulispora sp.]